MSFVPKMRYSVLVVLLGCLTILGAQLVARSALAATMVPFVGCVGDMDSPAPTGAPKSVEIDPSAGSSLAYYAGADWDPGALAPRGWHCAVSVGSSGVSLEILPPDTNCDSGSIINPRGYGVVYRSTDASGNWNPLDRKAWLFPDMAKREFAKLRSDPSTRDSVENPAKQHFGPYPGDNIKFVTGDTVKFSTSNRRSEIADDCFAAFSGRVWGVARVSEDSFDLITFRLPPGFAKRAAALVDAAEVLAFERRDFGLFGPEGNGSP